MQLGEREAEPGPDQKRKRGRAAAGEGGAVGSNTAREKVFGRVGKGGSGGKARAFKTTRGRDQGHAGGLDMAAFVERHPGGTGVPAPLPLAAHSVGRLGILQPGAPRIGGLLISVEPSSHIILRAY